MLILICGIPNAGKTTYAQRYDSVLHLDDMPLPNRYKALHEAVSKAEGDVIVEGTYVVASRRKELIQTCGDKSPKICIWLDTPLDKCRERERNSRKRPMALVDVHHQMLEPPTLEEGWDEIIILKGDKQMAYEKQTWECGEVISAEKLNHMEEGIEECCSGGGEPFIVTFTNTSSDPYAPTFTADKTFEEVANAIENGKVVRMKGTGLPARDEYLDMTYYNAGGDIYFSSADVYSGYVYITTYHYCYDGTIKRETTNFVAPR